MLDFVDKTFYQMPFTVQPSIVVAPLFGTLMRWNNGLAALLKHPVDKILSRVTSVSNDIVKLKTIQQGYCLSAVVPLPSGQVQSQRITPRVNGHMNFGAETTSTSPKRLFSLPSSFFVR